MVDKMDQTAGIIAQTQQVKAYITKAIVWFLDMVVSEDTRTPTKSERALPRSVTMTVTFLVMTLNFDPLISKCKGKFLSPSCIYV